MPIYCSRRQVTGGVGGPFRRSGWPVWLWVLAALCIAATDLFALRVAAALVLLGFLPGWALVEAWLPAPRQVVWRAALAGALSIVLSGFGTLYLV